MIEEQIHRAVVDYLAVALPLGSVVHHSPNEGRHKVQYRVKQTRRGVRAGWPDIEIFVNRTWWHREVAWSPLFLEVKTPTGRLSNSQRQVRQELIESGCRVGVVHSINEARDFLKNYVELRGA